MALNFNLGKISSVTNNSKDSEVVSAKKELEKAQNELSLYKFAETCKTKGINADLAKFLKSDADLDEFSKIFQ